MLAGGDPVPGFGRPLVQGLVAVAARVQLVVAVQPHVHEIRRDLLDERPLPWTVGYHERDPLPAQQLVELVGPEGLVADFDGMANALRWISNCGHCPVGRHALVMTDRDRRRGASGARQRLEECLETLSVEAQIGW